ncbi:hypothetical protein CDV31_015677 [Fusarium ambrosium]|uniref:Chitinase n=1 Tax=Fusarium ambrosium TaxID=131363 RepID=A0A428SKY2_9HYPO|nr:hypothetical protein CDV31_015677 [Fusarium ambrosium]
MFVSKNWDFNGIDIDWKPPDNEDGAASMVLLLEDMGAELYTVSSDDHLDLSIVALGELEHPDKLPEVTATVPSRGVSKPGVGQTLTRPLKIWTRGNSILTRLSTLILKQRPRWRNSPWGCLIGVHGTPKGITAIIKPSVNRENRYVSKRNLVSETGTEAQ